MAMDWMTKESHLKAVFPLTASNRVATYNWDVGTIERPHGLRPPVRSRLAPVGRPDRPERDVRGDGADGLQERIRQAHDNTSRLTLVRTPGVQGGYPDQGTLDLGHHEFLYGIAGHEGDFREGQTDWQGFRLNQPLVAFESAEA